jgi:tetratricopeptide (TPR) repeat protein
VGQTAFAIFAAAAVITAQDLSDISQQASRAMREGRFEEAERIYRQLVQKYPKNAGWHGNLGLALHSQNRFRDAVEALERSVRLRPSAGLSAVLGIDYLKLNEPCNAIAPLERTDRVEALADAYYACRRYPEAARLYSKLRKPRHAARAWWQARDYAQALPLYETLAPQVDDEPEFAWEYGDTLLRAQGVEAAIPWLERSAVLPQGRAALGKAYAEAGRFAEAIPHLEASVDLDRDLLLPLSRAYKATGRAADADRTLQEYRKHLSGRQ